MQVKMLEKCDTIRERTTSEPSGRNRKRPEYALFAGFVALLGLMAAVRYSKDISSMRAETVNLTKQVQDLSSQLKQVDAELVLPGAAMNRYRTSIGYIYASYGVGFPNRPIELEARVSGTGFLVSDDLVATNRHIAQPWSGDSDAQVLIRRGARPVLHELVIFFPDSEKPVPLGKISLSKISDLAILAAPGLHGRPVLPLAREPASVGDPVVVSGYPLGIAGMLARSPSTINERFAERPRDMWTAKQLAALSLIRPLVSSGRIGDIVGDELVYDAPTAHGGSGGPVFNSKSEVIAVNSAFIDGFSAGSIGISVKSLRQLLDEHSSHASRDPGQ